MEEAHLNCFDKDGLLPYSDYDVIVRGDGKLSVRVYVVSRHEEFVICLSAKTGCLLMVEKYGKRSKDSSFADVVEKVKEWLGKPSTLPSANKDINLNIVTLVWNVLNA